MKNIFSMDDPDYGKRGFFDPVFERQTYLNLLFLIIYLPVALICSPIIFGFMITGMALLPFYIGIHILLLSFELSQMFIGGQRKIFNIFFKEKIPGKNYPKNHEETTIKYFLHSLKNRHNRKSLLLHLVNPLLSGISILVPFLFMLVITGMIYTPLTTPFRPISIPYFLQNGSIIEAIFVFFIGLLVLTGILHLAGFWSRFINKIFILVWGD